MRHYVPFSRLNGWNPPPRPKTPRIATSRPQSADLSRRETVVLGMLLYWFEKGILPYQETAAQACRMPRRTLRFCVDSLKSKGYVQGSHWPPVPCRDIEGHAVVVRLERAA